MKRLAEKLLQRLGDLLLKYLEKALNADIDGDGKIG